MTTTETKKTTTETGKPGRTTETVTETGTPQSPPFPFQQPGKTTERTTEPGKTTETTTERK